MTDKLGIRSWRLSVVVLAALLVPSVTGRGVVPDRVAAASPVPRLAALRAASHPGYDRLVFQFSAGLPERRIVDFRVLSGVSQVALIF